MSCNNIRIKFAWDVFIALPIVINNYSENDNDGIILKISNEYD